MQYLGTWIKFAQPLVGHSGRFWVTSECKFMHVCEPLQVVSTANYAVACLRYFPAAAPWCAQKSRQAGSPLT